MIRGRLGSRVGVELRCIARLMWMSLAMAGVFACSSGKGKRAEDASSSVDPPIVSEPNAAPASQQSSKEKPKLTKAKVNRKREASKSELQEEAKEVAEKPSEEPVASAEALENPRPPRPEMSGQARRALESGRAAFLAGDLAGARKQYEAAIGADPQAFEAHRALGAVHERRGDFDQASKSYRAAYSIVPDDEASIVAHARLLANQNQFDQSLALIQKAESEWGASASLLTAKSETLSRQGRSDKAQELAQQALKKDPTFKPAMVALARDHYRARRIDLALYALTGILDGYGEGNPPRDPNNAEAHFLRGLIHSERGLRGPAMDEMRAALKTRPDLVDAHLMLAHYMMEAGNAEGARPHLESAVRYDNKNVEAHLLLGDAYRLLDQPDKARRELEWVLAAAPDQPEAHYNLGLLFLLGKDLKGLSEMQALDRAVMHLEAYKARGIRGGPDDVDELVTRAKTRQAVLEAQQNAKEGR